MAERHDELEHFTPYLMNRIIARYNRAVETALRDAGITVAQMRALAALAENGPRTVGELSVLTVIKQSTLSRVLDGMEAAGLVQRQAEDGDNRVRRIVLTPAGAAAHKAAWPAMLSMQDQHLKALQPDERKTLNRMLLRVFYDIRHHDY
ncbi:MarR family winged helix-turn-helix transcriptional regulator [Paracoccus rhizosphaerae]|uniref:MarR family winged helix-turn-helix transcriptional regulator n=1 Tax=Paracoccus rhizosphaerae TaxID=1133347 RepID=A0ABV6CN21_9RHOB|nr:MarR family transcriptional regulator [Paracoccus rhizosphaerae]